MLQSCQLLIVMPLQRKLPRQLEPSSLIQAPLAA
jgi:hypothetical protein